MAPPLVGIDAVIDTLAASEGSIASVTAAVCLLSEHLAGVQQAVDVKAVDEVTRRATDSLHSSSVRLERMMRLLERVADGNRGTAGSDAATLRRSVVLQLRAHAELEQTVLRQVQESLTAERGEALDNSNRRAPDGAVTSPRPTRSRATWWRHPFLGLRAVTSKAFRQ